MDTISVITHRVWLRGSLDMSAEIAQLLFTMKYYLRWRHPHALAIL